jgi:hypothetical protein
MLLPRLFTVEPVTSQRKGAEPSGPVVRVTLRT